MNKKKVRDKKGRFIHGYPTRRDPTTGKFTTLDKMDRETEEARQHILHMWYVLGGGEKRAKAQQKRKHGVDEYENVSDLDYTYSADYKEYE